MIKRYNPYTNYMMIESNEGKYVKYDDIKHVLERSDNSDYTKCCEDIEKLMMYRGEMPEQGQLVEILKKHFA